LEPTKCKTSGLIYAFHLDKLQLTIMSKPQQNSVDIEKWLKLIRTDNVGPVTFAKLIKHFGSPGRALGASVSELAKVDGIGFKTAKQIAATRNKFDATAELELAGKLGVWIISFIRLC